jgi:energy-coupling factor transport system ATP-binding protein
VISARSATTVWPDGREIGPFDLAIGAGERVLLSGRSGSGKSSLLRRLAGLERGAGRVEIRGRPIAEVPASERAGLLAFVAQEPLDQLIAATAGDELGFALGPAADRGARIAAAAAAIGVDVRADLERASGGTVQRVVVAAARIAGPPLMLLDEPLAWLDAVAAADLLSDLARAADAGATVVVAEHRVGLVRAWATREIALEGGRISTDGPPLPSDPPAARREPPPAGRRLVLRTPAVFRGDRRVLDPLEISLSRGDRVMVLGRNGAGKSTLLEALEGGAAVRVPQDPDLTLFCATVGEELGLAARDRGLSPDPVPLASALGLEARLADSPHSLSRGERLRLAVGAVLSADPDVVLLDEPTAGQDAASIEALLDVIGDRAAIVATHDLALARRAGTRAIVLVDGRAAYDGPPEGAEIPMDRTNVAVPLRPRGAHASRDVLLVLAVGTMAVSVDHAVALGALALVPAIGLARAAPRWRWAALGAAAAFTWSAVISQGLFYSDLPRVPLFSLGPIAIWREGVRHGLVQGLRATATTFAGLALAARHPPDRLRASLVRLGIPGGPAFLAGVSLRSLPLALREAAEVRAARARRGGPLSRLGPMARLSAEIDLLRPVVARALRRAATLGDSLLTRGFDPASPPLVEVAPIGASDRAVVAAAFALVACVVGIQAVTAAYLSELWYVPAWRPLYAFARTWL